MRIRATLLALAVVACSGVNGTATTDTVPIGTTSPSMPSTTTTTLDEPIPVVIDDCEAPQVGFSPLCEAYQLIEEWHMDRPIDPAVLADAALSGLTAFETDATETPPRTLICAIPDVAFTALCDELATQITESSVPVVDAMEAALVAMGDTGLEPFSYYVPPELVGSFRANGVVGGVGVLLDAADAAGSRCVRIAPTCPLEIIFVLEDNPGSNAGLEPGDWIVGVDGASVDGLGFVDVATRIAGDESGVVTLEIERDGRRSRLEIRREPLTIPTVEVEVPSPGVGYIRIPDFEEDIVGLVRQGLTSLLDSPIERLVVDLRDNPGGYVASAIDVASEFIDGGVVVRTVGPGEDFDYEAEPGGLASDVPVKVLVNGGTASAAEILALALRDRRDAQVIGEATYGKNAAQIAFELRNGGEFNVAVARWLSPNGATVAGTGIIPDFVTPLPASMPIEDLARLAYP
ncbi:MAG: S41 family peptidase [Acidimicrobiia bacterium]